MAQSSVGSSPPDDFVLFTIRLAQSDDVQAIAWLDTFGTSPHRNISRQVERYFGSVDPSVHERNLIFLAELRPEVATDLPYRLLGKAELLLAPEDQPSDVGYIKRVVVHPAWRQHGVGRTVMEYIIAEAPRLGVHNIDLHVWDGNTAAIQLYESLGFAERHRELYLRLALDERNGQPVSTPPAKG